MEAGSQGLNCEIGGGPPEVQAADGICRWKALRASDVVLLDESTTKAALTFGRRAIRRRLPSAMWGVRGPFRKLRAQPKKLRRRGVASARPPSAIADDVRERD